MASTITGITPNAGLISGGNEVSITGDFNLHAPGSTWRVSFIGAGLATVLNDFASSTNALLCVVPPGVEVGPVTILVLSWKGAEDIEGATGSATYYYLGDEWVASPPYPAALATRQFHTGGWGQPLLTQHQPFTASPAVAGASFNRLPRAGHSPGSAFTFHTVAQSHPYGGAWTTRRLTPGPWAPSAIYDPTAQNNATTTAQMMPLL